MEEDKIDFIFVEKSVALSVPRLSKYNKDSTYVVVFGKQIMKSCLAFKMHIKVNNDERTFWVFPHKENGKHQFINTKNGKIYYNFRKTRNSENVTIFSEGVFKLSDII